MVKIMLKMKKISEGLEIWFRVWKHIIGKNYLENEKIQGSKFDY